MINNRLSTLRSFKLSCRTGIRQYSGGRFGGFNAALPWNTIVKFVPQQDSWVVERFGKFSRVLQPGMSFLIPFIERISYAHSMKEAAVEIPSQSAITSDNVSLELDGVLYYRIIDAYKASYGVEDPHYAVAQLAQTTMRAQIGMLTLDRTLAERTLLNTRIVEAINEAADSWGIECLRYEVRDVHLPGPVLESMHSQVAAERSKRAAILESEGNRQAAINVAEGRRTAQILASEGELQETLNRASGAAESVRREASAAADAIKVLGEAIDNGKHSNDAVSLSLAQRWVDAWANIAKNAGSVVVLGSSTGTSQSGFDSSNKLNSTPSGPLNATVADPAAMVVQSLALFNRLTAQQKKLEVCSEKNETGKDQK